MQVIMIVRLYAMYQRSKKVLIPLVVIFLTLSIINVTTSGRATRNSSAVVLILSGSYVCSPSFNGNGVLLVDLAWIIGIAWEVFVLSLAVWIAVIHIRELPRSSTRGILEDCFTVLIKTHVVYFTSFVAVSCFQIGYLSPALSTVCQSDTHLCMRARFIVSIEPIFFGDSDISWPFSDFHARTDGRAGTTPNPRRSRI
ncbi:hypothetical protein BDR06DRAFT_29266 [Suillus hirtellus]|nr:hypothetical protein BDR06DRAFT_29266 [Suillus hirtellus]